MTHCWCGRPLGHEAVPDCTVSPLGVTVVGGNIRIVTWSSPPPIGADIFIGRGEDYASGSACACGQSGVHRTVEGCGGSNMIRTSWRPFQLDLEIEVGEVVEGEGETAGYPDEEAVLTLVEMAKAGKEEDFRDLGAALGVPGEELDEMWEGTRRRLGH